MANIEYIPAKTIVTKGKTSQYYLPFDYVMNIYRGCNHGCIYCYARSNFYEKTDNFDKIRVKENALQIIRDDLRRKVRTGIVLTGGVSDPYNPYEKELNLTRNALELINAFEFGACIITKSDLATRDTDILTDIKSHSPVTINFTITCAEDEMSKKIETNVSTSSQRFKAIEHLSKAGLTTGVLIDPVMPFLTDTEENVINLVKKAKAHGAKYVYISTAVTLADVQRDYFYRELDKIEGGISDRYIKKYASRYKCPSPKSKKLWNLFVETCEKEKIAWNMPDVNKMVRQGYAGRQLSFNM